MTMLPTNCLISEWTDWSNCQQGKLENGFLKEYSFLQNINVNLKLNYYFYKTHLYF